MLYFKGLAVAQSCEKTGLAPGPGSMVAVGCVRVLWAVRGFSYLLEKSANSFNSPV